MIEIINTVADLFPEFSLEVESVNNVKTLRIKLKKFTLEQDEINSLFKIHPFRIHLAAHNDISGTKLNLFFDFVS